MGGFPLPPHPLARGALQKVAGRKVAKYDRQQQQQKGAAAGGAGGGGGGGQDSKWHFKASIGKEIKYFLRVSLFRFFSDAL